MCGIAGYWDKAGLSDDATDVLGRMTDAIAHRGPDDSGAMCDRGHGIAIGHRRLSIIDTSAAGHQPMASRSQRYRIVFNGEIYNFRELRNELESAGIRFYGSSDTEVLLEAIEKWGLTVAVKRAAGMFAFALWDTEMRSLHLVRDRIGEKPLYYGVMGNTLLFGSELKALRQHPSWNAEIDRGALALYMRFSYVPAPHSIYAGIRKVRPGTILTFDATAGSAPTELVYWSAREAAEHGSADPLRVSDTELVELCNARLAATVGELMVSDVPLGAFLSGGIDSSLIVALMQAQSRQPVKTFTIGLWHKEYDEADHARAVAAHLGTDHTELYITPQEALDVIPRLPAMYDEPFADSSQIPTFLVSQLARSRVTVSLSGDGGDEVFGGYHRYVYGERLRRNLRLVPVSVRKMIAHGIRTLSPNQWNSVFSSGASMLRTRRLSIPGERMHKLANVLAARTTEEIYEDFVTMWREPVLIGTGSPALATFLTDKSSWATLDDFAQRMMYLDMVSYLPDDILVKVDRATMAVSLESRAPFLDHRVIEFAWRVPQNSKIRAEKTKWLLRELLDRYVPRTLVERPKQGFGIPLDHWLRGELRDWAGDLLDPDRLRREGYFDADVVTRKWNEHQSGSRNWQHLLWSVLMFQAWIADQ